MSWKVEKKEPSTFFGIAHVVSLGMGSEAYDYTIRNEETGEVKQTCARDEKELGENIANGRMHDVD